MRTAESEAVIVEAGGITVEKRYEPDEFPVPAMEFTISSSRDEPITVRMADTLPEKADPADIGFHPEHGGEHWSADDDTLVFKRPFEPNEQYVTVYGFRHIHVDTLDQLLVEPDIEILNPTSEILGENSGDHIREVIAGENASDGHETDGQQPESDSVPSADSAPPTDSVAATLAEEIRTGSVNRETLSVLRDHLGVDGSGAPAQDGHDSSMDARIRRLQADVGDLRAYTDALEEFLSENGEAQTILADFRQEIDSLEPRVASLESQLDEVTDGLSGRLDDFSTDIGALSTNVDSLTTEVDSISNDMGSLTNDVDSLREYTDSLGSDIETIESDVDSVSTDISRLQSRVRRLDNTTATEEDIEEIREKLKELAAFRQRMQSVFTGGET